MKKIVICGGHLTPALALIEKLEKEKNLQVVFFGRKYATEGVSSFSAEYRIINKKKIAFYEITTGRLQRKFTRYTILSLLKLPVGFLQSFIYLIKVRPSLVVSFGSYISVPPVLAAWLLGIGVIAHEQALAPGLATKINSLFVKKIFLSWGKTARFFPGEKTEVIGNLIRGDVFKKSCRDKKIGAFLRGAKKLIFVTGGNQGSSFLNNLIFEAVGNLGSYAIIHQVGTANWRGDYERVRKVNHDNYLAIDYIDACDIGAIFNKAAIVIARSGVNTVWELAILGKPAILVPLPRTIQKEQYANAQILADAASVTVLDQESLDADKLKETVDNMFANLERYTLAAQNFKKKLPGDAAQKLSSYILAGYT